MTDDIFDSLTADNELGNELADGLREDTGSVELELTVDVYDPIHRAAQEAGIDVGEMNVDAVEITNDGDLTVEITGPYQNPVEGE